MKIPVYLDNNATTPCDPRVVEAMLPYFTENFGNSSSRSHSFGWIAEEAVNHAREQVALLINADPKEIIFTSGATEADNLVLKGLFEMYAGKGNHIITINIEHKAVLDTCKNIEKSGGDITYLQVHNDGLIDLTALEAVIKPATILIAVMYANNEIGVIQPIKEISAIAKKHNILFFTDAVQAVGKIPVDVKNDGLDLVALSAHKMYGPKGIGALYIRGKNPGVKIMAQIDGGGHERGMRSGTLNVPGIVGFGKAAELSHQEMVHDALRLQVLRDRLERELLRLDGTTLNGNSAYRLPHVTNISFQSVEGEDLLMNLAKHVALSSGSACTSATKEPSYVLKALGIEDDLAHSSIRFSLGRFTSDEEIDFVIKQVMETVTRLRQIVK